MTSTKYQYRSGAKLKGVSAEDTYKELERIRADGGITASAVVEQARPKDAVLHPAFEWSNKKAAHEHRLWQARQIVRAVVVVTDDRPAEQVYVHVAARQQEGENKNFEGRYEPVELVVNSPDLFEQAISELRDRLRSAGEAVQALERAAQKSADPDKMMRVSLAVKALDAANSALAALH